MLPMGQVRSSARAPHDTTHSAGITRAEKVQRAVKYIFSKASTRAPIQGRINAANGGGVWDMPASGPGYPGAWPGDLRSFRGGLTTNDVWHEVEVKRIRRPPRGDHRHVLLLSLHLFSQLNFLPPGRPQKIRRGAGGGWSECALLVLCCTAFLLRYGAIWGPATCVGQARQMCGTRAGY